MKKMADIPAVVLAGGLGKRLRQAVPDLPKPMAPLRGRPFLEHLLAWLGGQSVRRVVLSVGYRWEAIERHFGRSFGPVEIDYCVEDAPLGTGGAAREALERLDAPNVLLLNGDTMFDVPLAALARAHGQSQADATLALKELRNFDRYGIVEVRDGRIVAFREKAPCARGLINGGVYLFRRELLAGPDLPEAFSLERDVFERRANELHLGAFVSDGYFVDIGVPEDYQRAQRELPEYFA
ncbi:MAG TPA: D-glycero-D-manno-heptose 1-phosphate guanosyltransferase [Phycisphaerales bacterium]|nr:D-glycero-D-manno-heptose 1-phosphate guanosyltransferase [Phycisphaerales bacterium]